MSEEQLPEDDIVSTPEPENPETPEPDAPEPETPQRPAQVFNTAEQRDEAMAAAVAAIRAGECIVLPTDTVYGIGANAMDRDAVQKLLDAKHRGRDMPPPVLIADAASLGALVQFIDEDAKALAAKFWPGALTIILRTQEGLRIDLGETRGTIAVRVPDHEFTRALLRRTGPLAVSSANISGQESSTDMAEARRQLGDAVAVYLDAGQTPGMTPSTIVDFTVTTLGKVLRRGVITLEQLREVAAYVEDIDEPEADEPEPAEPEAAEPAPEPPPNA
ncbi:L-threonylcarbamoyladenylate synthase [Propionibacteriaceae bacterium G57]|uniref:L-threonylcarbamoyladenylate synthase n=1 Tax=Aestuariimicrobium sp. G57 TaxID=3418485 RepID=UPI003DA7A1FC